MAGKPIEDLQIGLFSMLSALKRDPHAMETVFMSIITFDARARVLIPLTELSLIQAPELSIHPGTAMGEALSLLYTSIDKDVKKSTSSAKGDYKPIVFILTDGKPTDEWQRASDLLQNVTPKIANIYAIGCGDEVDFSVLNKITQNCIYLKGLSTEHFAKLFVWLSASVQSQSVAVSPDMPVNLEKIPLQGGMSLIDSQNLPKSTNKPRLFFHSMCQKYKKYFLLRYKYDEENQLYFSDEPIALKDDFFSEGKKAGKQIETSQLADIPVCPYCGATSYTRCPSCGTIFCLTESPTAICPNCNKRLNIAKGDGTITIDGSLG
jgi:uncharacterized protein YegL